MAINKVKEFFDDLLGDKKTTVGNDIGGEDLNLAYFEIMLREFYSTENMRLKTDLKRNQVFLLSVATVYRDVYKSEVMDRFITYLLEHNVSINRLGREEFAKIFNFITQNAVDGVDPMTGLASVLGLGRRI